MTELILKIIGKKEVVFSERRITDPIAVGIIGWIQTYVYLADNVDKLNLILADIYKNSGIQVSVFKIEENFLKITYESRRSQ